MKAIKNIWAWLKSSRHALHLFGEVIITYIVGIFFAIGVALGIEQDQGWQGDWKQDLLADGIGIVVGQLLLLLVIGLWGWQTWLGSLFVIAIFAMSGIPTKLIKPLRPYKQPIQVAGLALGVLAFISLIIIG